MSLADLLGLIDDADLKHLAALCGKAETLEAAAGGSLPRRQEEIATTVQQVSSRRAADAHRTQLAVAK